MRGLSVDSRFGVLVVAAGTGNRAIPSVLTAQPMVLYVVASTGEAGDRVTLVGSGTQQFAAGRSQAGDSWFALTIAAGGSIVAASIPETAGPSVICGVRLLTSLTVQGLSGARNTIATSGWPPAPALTTAVVDDSITHWELWAGRAHTPDVQAEIIDRLAARFL